MIRFCSIVLLLLCSPAFGWWDTDWDYRQKITIDATLVDEATHVIPVYLSPGDSTFWTNVKAAGADIRFATDADVLIAHYLVDSFTDSGTTGTGVCLVDVASIISASVDVDFYIYYGNSAASDTSSGSDVFDSTDIEGFYLPGETLTDITGGGRDLTAGNAPTTATSGYEGITAAVYNGTNQYHYTGTSPISDWPATLEALSYHPAVGAGTIVAVNGVWTDQFGLWSTASGFKDLYRTWATNTGYAVQPVSVSPAVWTYLAGTRDTATTGTTRNYYDGVAKGTDTTNTGALSWDSVAIGVSYFPALQSYWAGHVAMAAVHDVVRSANYIATNYEAWSNASFLTWTASEAEASTETGWVLLLAAADGGFGGSSVWANPGNAIVVSGYSENTPEEQDYSSILNITDMDATVPSGKQIDGIQVRIRRYYEDSSEAKDLTVQLIVDGTATGDNKASAIFWPTSATNIDYGGATDDWGTSLTEAQANASNFGIKIIVEDQGSGEEYARIETVWINVSYSDAPTITDLDKARGFFF